MSNKNPRVKLPVFTGNRAFDAWWPTIRENGPGHPDWSMDNYEYHPIDDPMHDAFEAGQAAERESILGSLKAFREEYCTPDTGLGDALSKLMAEFSCRGFRDMMEAAQHRWAQYETLDADGTRVVHLAGSHSVDGYHNDCPLCAAIHPVLIRDIVTKHGDPSIPRCPMCLSGETYEDRSPHLMRVMCHCSTCSFNWSPQERQP